MSTLTASDCGNQSFIQWPLSPRYKGHNQSYWPIEAVPSSPKHDCIKWSYLVRSEYDSPRRVIRAFHWHARIVSENVVISSPAAFHLIAGQYQLAPAVPMLPPPRTSAETESKREEFSSLAERWRNDTKYLSITSKAVSHPDYFQIVAMGSAAIPLILEELRDRPAHWFVALRALAKTDPVPRDANPSAARQAWLEWGRHHGYID